MLKSRAFLFSRYNLFHSSCVARMGGYIEEAQLVMLGLDVYKDFHGEAAYPDFSFIVPDGDEKWPCNLWGFQLGQGAFQYSPLKFTPNVLRAIEKECAVGIVQITNSKMIKHAADQKGQKQAAVLVSLCNSHGIASLLFTIRSLNVGTHKGHVSFPGGHIVKGETATEAAVRETYEEIGCAPESVRVLGVCQTVPAITGTLVTPVIGYFFSFSRSLLSFFPPSLLFSPLLSFFLYYLTHTNPQFCAQTNSHTYAYALTHIFT